LAYNQAIVDAFPQIDVKVNANTHKGPLYFTIRSGDFDEIVAQNDVSKDVMKGMVKTFKDAVLAYHDHAQWTWYMDRGGDGAENAFMDKYEDGFGEHGTFDEDDFDQKALDKWKKVYTALAKDPLYWIEEASFIGPDTGSNAPAFFTTRDLSEGTDEDEEWLEDNYDDICA
jgi:hypothetical protein